MAERYRVAPAVYLLLERDGKDQGTKEILLMRRANTSYRNGEYSLIAGHLDANESLRGALAREAKEEADITVDPENLEYVHVMHAAPEIAGDLDDQRIDFYFRATVYEGEPQIMEPDKCDDMQWFPEDHLPPNIVPKVHEAIQHIRAGETFSEVGW